MLELLVGTSISEASSDIVSSFPAGIYSLISTIFFFGRMISRDDARVIAVEIEVGCS